MTRRILRDAWQFSELRVEAFRFWQAELFPEADWIAEDLQRRYR